MGNTQPRTNELAPIAAGVLILIFPVLLMTVPKAGGIALLLLLIVSLTGLLCDKKTIPLNKDERNLVLIVFIFSLVYVINILNFDKGFREFDDASRFLLLLPVFLYLRKIKLRVEYFLIGIFLGALACASIAFYQKFHLGLPRSYGITNPVPFGGISIVLGLMCLPGALLTSVPKYFRVLMLLGFFLGLAGSIFSGTRGAWLALPVCFFVIIAINPMKWSLTKKLASSLILVSSISGAYLHPDIQTRVDTSVSQFNAYFSENTVNTSVGLRLEAWRASTIAISGSPTFGVGEGNFRDTMKELANEGLADPGVKTLAHVHNEYLTAMLQRGLVGLASLILIFVVPLRVFIKSSKQETGLNQLLPMSGIILITSYMTFSLTDIVFEHQNTTLLYASFIFIIYGMSNSISRNAAQAPPQQ